MIQCEGLRFVYPGESFELRIDELRIEAGESVALIGPSGCGKTTLLNLIAGILLPETGSMRVAETNLGSLSLRERQRFRLAHIGMVPQNFELLDYLTVEENLLVPFRLAGKGAVPQIAKERAQELAERSGISDLLGKYHSQMSQGERQRAALCRGLIASPQLILADEPTGNLDPENQDKIVSLLLDETRRIGATVVMITHEPELKRRFDRVIDVLALRKEVEA